MTTFTRRNAWNNGGTFDNPDLLWYAKAVGKMQSLGIDKCNSWWFYAAMHGQNFINQPSGYPNWADIPAPPAVPTSPLPSDADIKLYWDQCQHGTWYFPPWHRGYLYALENVLRGIIQEMGGPADWALPYWNYFGTGNSGNEFKMPAAFAQKLLPDGTTPNPLYVEARYGPDNDQNIYVPLDTLSPPWLSWAIDQECQNKTIYTGVSPNYYGGDVTGFDHARKPNKTGALESNPHNITHVAIGGQYPPDNEFGGLMGMDDTAALDPIFYLHHCNIDRMWAAWNAAGHSNPTQNEYPNWFNGPAATGGRAFCMPTPDCTPWYYTPGMVTDISMLNYTYDDLHLGTAVPAVSRNTQRLLNLAVPSNEFKTAKSMAENVHTELVGANNENISIAASGAHTKVKLDSKGWGSVNKSLLAAATTSLPDEVYLQLEGIKGTQDSVVCTVSVNNQYVDHISFFGLRNASKNDGAHGGEGLTITLDITAIIDKLFVGHSIDVSLLDVRIQPVNKVAEGKEVTIDRVSVYRANHK